MEHLSAVKDLVLAVAGIVGAVVAWRGLSTWQRQLRGQADFEAARRLARATYKLRDAIAAARSPFISAAEFPDGSAGTTAGTAVEKAAAQSHVFRNRWRPILEVLEEFDAATLECEALWGDSIRQVTDDLRRCLGELRSAADDIVENLQEGGSLFANDPELGRQTRRIAFGRPGDTNNPFTKKLADAVQEVERVMKPHLKRQ